MNSDSVERSATEAAGRPTLLRDFLAAHLSDLGMFGVRFLSREAFLEVLDGVGISTETMRKYNAADAESVVIAALRYGEGGYPPPTWTGWPDPMVNGSIRPFPEDNRVTLRIARFARANWYGELSGRLLAAVTKTIAQAKGDGIDLPPARSWHRLVNSGLPEKPLAERAGLGWIGKNGILIAAGGAQAGKGNQPADGAPPYSSAVVLGLLLCPVELGPGTEAPIKNLCGECRRCIEACPTRALGVRASGKRALSAGFGYDRTRCIQHWTAIDGEVPPEVLAAWDGRLYGCDNCLDACPFFRTDPLATTRLGLLGPVLPASWLASHDDSRIRLDLEGSALDRTWMSIEAFRRSARLALKASSGASGAGETFGTDKTSE